MKIEQWSLPQRREYIKRLRESGTKDFEYPLEFKGRVQNYNVYTVPIELPCYRLSNGRTRSAQKELIALKGLAPDFFSADPDSAAALKEQETILKNMVKGKERENILKILREHKQSEPLILDNDGYIVNGNRRICAMYVLLEKDEIEYKHFKRIQVIFLPPCEQRDIKALEGRLQVSPEGKAEYTWIDKAILYREWLELGSSEDEVADLYEKKVAEIREFIDVLDEAEQYLETREKTEQYSLVQKKEYAFKQLLKYRKKLRDDEPKKEFLTTISYIMIDDPDTGKRRLYESIEDAYKFLEELGDGCNREFKDQLQDSETTEDKLTLLGDEKVENPYSSILKVLEKSENREKAQKVIQDTLQEMRAAEEERRDATYCRRQIQQAHNKLQLALSSFDENSDTTGILETLKNIEDVVRDIRKWLKDANANN